MKSKLLEILPILLGLAILTAGIALMSVAAALIVLGVLVLAGAVVRDFWAAQGPSEVKR